VKLAPRSDLVPLRPGYVARDWQLTAARSLGYHARAGTKRMIISAATGVGKGDLLAAFIAKAVWQGKRVGFAVHRDFLLQDVYERALGIEPAMYAGRVQGRMNEVDRHAVFMSLQTVRDKERAKSIGALSWLFVDEAHYFMCPSGFAVLEALEEVNPGLRVVGCTATPFRSAGGGRTSGLGAMFGTDVGGLDSPISEYSIADGIADGVLSPMHALRLPPMYERGKVKKDDDVKVADALDTDDHNEAVVRKYLEHRAPGIAFCASVGHAVHLAEMFRRHGVRAEAVWDSSSTVDKRTGEKFGKDKGRDAKIKAAQAGEIEVLTNLDLLSTGFDWRPCSVMMSVRPTMSPGLFAQEVGRVTRLSPETGKEYGLVLDFVDNTVLHDLGLGADLSTPEARERTFDPGDVVRHRRDPRLVEGIVTDVRDDGRTVYVRWRGASPEWYGADDLSLVRKRSEREEIRIAPRVIGLQEYKVELIRGDATVGWYAYAGTSGKTWTVRAQLPSGEARVQVRISADKRFDVWFVPKDGTPTLERAGVEKSEDAMAWAAGRVRELDGRVTKPDEEWKRQPSNAKQHGFLKFLGLRRDCTSLTMGEASSLIDALSANMAILDYLDPSRIATREMQRRRFGKRASA
jgi:superfamily II DNA or RNA helicase